MIYCSVDEAFDKSLDERYNSNNKSIPNIYNTQGDIESLTSNNYGTPISQIESQPSIESTPPKKTQQHPIFRHHEMDKIPNVRHDYCIKRFVDSIIYNDDTRTVDSSDDQLYNHLKTCKYCKTQVNTKIKQYYDKPTITTTTKEVTNIEEGFNDTDYNVKEIILIILVAILLVCVIDLIIKFSKIT